MAVEVKTHPLPNPPLEGEGGLGLRMTRIRIRNLPWFDSTWSELHALRARHVHALLLNGQAGIGKKGLAIDFAARLLCENAAGNGRACGRCVGCRMVAARSHPDLRIVVPDTLSWLRPPPLEDDDGESADVDVESREGRGRIGREIGIDPVRKLADLAGIASHRGGARVVVLAPAESLTAPAANALLKLLEEPPFGFFFVLVSNSLGDVLPTIRSRCVLLRVPPPATAHALAWMRAQGIEDVEHALAAFGGAPVELIEAEAATDERLDPQLREQMIAMLRQGARLIAAEIATRLPRTLHLPDTIALLQRWGWDLLAVRMARRVRYHPAERETLGSIADGADPTALCGWLVKLQGARATEDHPLNGRLAAEALLIAYADCLNAR